MSEISELKSSIEALIAERDALFRRATLAEEWRDHDKTRAEAAESKLAENEVRLGKAVEALEALIQQTHDCEKELTEDLHHVDLCGESAPLTNAIATLADIKGENHE